MSKIKLAPVFSNHMVLQREKPICIWGTCDDQGEIEAELNGITASGNVHEGKWKVAFPPMETTRNLTLIVRTEKESISVEDVAIGEVWIAGGQSNMEFYMKYDFHFEEEIINPQNLDIRFFDVPELCYSGHEKDHDFSKMGFWRICNAENLEYYSAVGYYFAKHVQGELSVPVGIIGCNRGESPVASWIPEESVKKIAPIWCDDFENSLYGKSEEEALEKYRTADIADRGNPFADDLNNQICYGLSHEEQEKLLENMPEQSKEDMVTSFHTKPGCLFENMLKKIVPYTARGIIWYQGETDSLHPEYFKELWSEMIDCWREMWNEPLPFLSVQLAPFEQWLWCVGENFPKIRTSQYEISTEKDQVYLVSSSDAGMRYDIHPKNKKPIGIRLALCAEKYIYGRKVAADAPVGTECYRDGSDLCIHFACDTDTLLLKGDHISALQLSYIEEGMEKQVDLTDVKYKIDGTVLIVKNLYDKENRSFKVSLAETDYYEMNLYSEAGIPAMPFSGIVK